MTDPQSTGTSYQYDAANLLDSLNYSTGNQQFGFEYDELNRRKKLTRPNGVNTEYVYDPDKGFVTDILHKNSGGAVIDGASYAPDAVGNRQSKTNKLTNVAQSYSYDNLYQLKTVTQTVNGQPAMTEFYNYDGAGNRTSSHLSSGYSFNNDANRLYGTDAAAYDYDNNGNLTSKVEGQAPNQNTTGYGWDAENRMTSVTLPNNGGAVTFKYDPFGRRIYKSSPSGTTIYVYDGANVLEERDGAGTWQARYTQGPGVDEPLAMLRGGVTSYYQADGVGSVTSLTDGSGAVIATYTYDSFGKITNTTGTIINPFRYTGREWDAETGLYYYRARYYDPQTGRFISEDPIRFNGGVNFYAYTEDNPIGRIDPSGYDALDYVLNDGTASFFGGAGASLSFGLTNVVNRLTGADSVVDHCSFAYNSGEWAGTLLGLAFGAEQLARTAFLQAGEQGLWQGLRRLAFDKRTWGAVRRTWSEAAGGGEPFLQDAGQSLHHWLLPQRWDFVPQGIRNAGFNYLPISAEFNSWMNGSTAVRQLTEWGFKGVVGGIYGSLAQPGH